MAPLGAEKAVPEYKLEKNQRATPENVQLHNAAAKGDLAGVERALKMDGSPNWLNHQEEGAAALHRAAEGGYTEVMSALVGAGAILDEQQLASKNTPLHVAAARGHLGAVNFLLKSGASVGLENAYGNSPLHSSLMSGSIEVVRALVESAADVQHTNHKGTPPLHFALYCEMPEEKRADMVKILLDSGADATAVDDSGLSALHVACRDGQDEIINLLLEQKGVDPNCQDIHGHTPLYYADESRKELTAKLLSA